MIGQESEGFPCLDAVFGPSNPCQPALHPPQTGPLAGMCAVPFPDAHATLVRLLPAWRPALFICLSCFRLHWAMPACYGCMPSWWWNTVEIYIMHTDAQRSIQKYAEYSRWCFHLVVCLILHQQHCTITQFRFCQYFNIIICLRDTFILLMYQYMLWVLLNTTLRYYICVCYATLNITFIMCVTVVCNVLFFSLFSSFNDDLWLNLF